MDLLEYQGKQLFSKHGVSVPEGRPATTVPEAVEAAEELGYPVVIKAQVQIGGRGKAGGIKLASDRAEAERNATAILGMDIRGYTVHELYVEKASEIDEEYYAAIVFDRAAKKPMAMLSRMGGMDVEEVAETDPEAMRMLHVDPLLGLQDFQGRRLAYESGIAEDVIRPVGAMLAKLYDVFVREDATLVEVNPLLVTKAREVMALDAKVTVDDNALFRHPDVAEMRDLSAEDPQERMAKERGLTYVKLDGNVGILGNLLDVHAAHAAQHRHRLLGRAVEHDRGVVLLVDLRGLLHVQLVHREAADVHPEDRRGVLLGLRPVPGQLDAARLATAADLDLGLDHDRVAELVGGLDGLRDGGRGTPVRHGDAVLLKQLLSLVFEEVHRG